MATKTFNFGSSGCWVSTILKANGIASYGSNTFTTGRLRMSSGGTYGNTAAEIDIIIPMSLIGGANTTINKITVNFSAVGQTLQWTIYDKGSCIVGYLFAPPKSSDDFATSVISHEKDIPRANSTPKNYSDIIQGSNFNSHHFTYNGVECIGVAIGVWNPNTSWDETYAFTNVSFVVDYSLPKYTLTVNSNNSNYGTVAGGGSYDMGTYVTITATPKAGHRFVKWNDGDTSASRTITVSANVTYTAEFVPSNRPINVTSNNTSYGTVTGGGTYPVGTSVTITATANPGYRFVSWSDGDTNATRTVTVTNSGGYYGATFEPLSTMSNIYVGASNVQEIYVGAQQVKCVYLGNTKVYEKQ